MAHLGHDRCRPSGPFKPNMAHPTSFALPTCLDHGPAVDEYGTYSRNKVTLAFICLLKLCTAPSPSPLALHVGADACPALSSMRHSQGMVSVGQFSSMSVTASVRAMYRALRSSHTLLYDISYPWRQPLMILVNLCIPLWWAGVAWNALSSNVGALLLSTKDRPVALSCP